MGKLFLIGETAAGSTMGSKLNTALQNSVDPNSFMDGFIDILPWVGGLVVVAFLVYEARKLIKGASKAKVRV